MGHRSIHRKELAFYPEVTPCAPPANWASSGTAIEFISVDISGAKEALVVDPTAERRILANGKRKKINGIRNVDWSAVLKLHGTGAASTEDTQIAETYLSKILAWCCGGVHRSYTREVVSGTTTTLTVGEGLTTGFIPGCLVAIEDTTSPTDQDEGRLHFARVVEVDAGTDTITLAEALPFTPAAGDIIHGTITIYVDETVLEDAIRNGTIHTWNWLVKLHTSNTDELWQLEGTVANFTIQNLSRGQLPQIALSCMSANFRHSGEDGLTSPTFTSAAGSPQLSMGLDVRCSISDYSATARADMDVNTAAFEPGFSRVRVETGTQVIDRFDGMSTYSVAPGDTKFTATVVPHSASWYGGLKDGTEYRIMYYQPGPGGGASSGAGKAWALCLPRTQVGATPGRVDVNEIHGAQVEFSAMIPDDTTGGSNAELVASPFLIGLA